MRVAVAIVAGRIWSASPAWAQTPRAITIDDLYDPASRIDFSGCAPADLAWISDPPVDPARGAHAPDAVRVHARDAAERASSPRHERRRAGASLSLP